jgi:hypothetical protein
MTTEYRLLESTDPRNLSADVTAYLKKGWKLHGELKVIHVEGQLCMYHQVVVKET